MNAVVKAERERHKEQMHQIHIIFPAVFTVLWQQGWREKRIMSRLTESIDAMRCGYQEGLSVLEVMERETGIEMTLEGDKSFHEYAYFSSDTQVKPLNTMQELYMIKRITKWMPTMMLAGICIALHRKDGWGFDRLSDFINKVNIIRATLGEDEAAYAKYMKEETGHEESELWRK